MNMDGIKLTIELGVITGGFGIVVTLMKLWHSNMQRDIRTALLEHRVAITADLNGFAILLERQTGHGSSRDERIAELHRDLIGVRSAIADISGRLIRIETTCRARCETSERGQE